MYRNLPFLHRVRAQFTPIFFAARRASVHKLIKKGQVIRRARKAGKHNAIRERREKRTLKKSSLKAKTKTKKTIGRRKKKRGDLPPTHQDDMCMTA